MMVIIRMSRWGAHYSFTSTFSLKVANECLYRSSSLRFALEQCIRIGAHSVVQANKEYFRLFSFIELVQMPTVSIEQLTAIAIPIPFFHFSYVLWWSNVIVHEKSVLFLEFRKSKTRNPISVNNQSTISLSIC